MKLLLLLLLTQGLMFGFDSVEICRLSFPSVYVINAKDKNGRDLSYGSGFHVGDGRVVTNLHVVQGASVVTVRRINSKDDKPIRGFTGVDVVNDLVVLQVDSPLGDKLDVDAGPERPIGEDVYAVGNPQGLEGTFSKGMISAYRSLPEKKIMQITAPISPGSSGGPIVSVEGKVIGVAVSYFANGQNLNFAVPAAAIHGILGKLKSPRNIGDLPAEQGKAIEDAKLVPVKIGLVQLSIGESQKDAVSRLREFYNVQDLKTGCYIVIEKSDDEFKTIGSVTCQNGIVVSAMVDGKTIHGQAPVNLVKMLYAKIVERQASEKSNACIVSAKVSTVDDPISKSTVRLYEIRLIFDGYSIELFVNDPSTDKNAATVNISEKYRR